MWSCLLKRKKKNWSRCSYRVVALKLGCHKNLCWKLSPGDKGIPVDEGWKENKGPAGQEKLISSGDETGCVKDWPLYSCWPH